MLHPLVYRHLTKESIHADFSEVTWEMWSWRLVCISLFMCIYLKWSHLTLFYRLWDLLSILPSLLHLTNCSAASSVDCSSSSSLFSLKIFSKPGWPTFQQRCFCTILSCRFHVFKEVFDSQKVVYCHICQISVTNTSPPIRCWPIGSVHSFSRLSPSPVLSRRKTYGHLYP